MKDQEQTARVFFIELFARGCGIGIEEAEKRWVEFKRELNEEGEFPCSDERFEAGKSGVYYAWQWIYRHDKTVNDIKQSKADAGPNSAVVLYGCYNAHRVFLYRTNEEMNANIHGENAIKDWTVNELQFIPASWLADKLRDWEQSK